MNIYTHSNFYVYILNTVGSKIPSVNSPTCDHNKWVAPYPQKWKLPCRVHIIFSLTVRLKNKSRPHDERWSVLKKTKMIQSDWYKSQV